MLTMLGWGRGQTPGRIFFFGPFMEVLHVLQICPIYSDPRKFLSKAAKACLLIYRIILFPNQRYMLEVAKMVKWFGCRRSIGKILLFCWSFVSFSMICLKVSHLLINSMIGTGLISMFELLFGYFMGGLQAAFFLQTRYRPINIASC